MFTKDLYPSPISILGVTTIAGTALPIAVGGRNIKFINVSGNIWVNPLTTAVAGTTALKTVAGETLEFTCKTLSIISDVTTGTYQYYIW